MVLPFYPVFFVIKAKTRKIKTKKKLLPNVLSSSKIYYDTTHVNLSIGTSLVADKLLKDTQKNVKKKKCKHNATNTDTY